MRLQVLALDGIFDTGLATVLDVFETANALARSLPLKAPRFDVSVVGLRRRLRTAHGFQVPVTALYKPGAADWTVVPALATKTPDTLLPALERRDVVEAAAALKEDAAAKRSIAAACVGTFILAEAGILNRQKATTTWWLAPLFRARYPEVALDDARMLVKSSRFVTAGAALSHVDMALHLVREVNPELANMVSRYLIADARSAQSVYAVADHLAHADPMVERFEHWARKHLAAGFSLEAAAEAAGASKRTLARRMQQVLGRSPLSYFQDLRVEHAVRLLRTSRKSFDQIAQSVGYADGVTLRTLLRRRLGHGVRELRKSIPPA